VRLVISPLIDLHIGIAAWVVVACGHILIAIAFDVSIAMVAGVAMVTAGVLGVEIAVMAFAGDSDGI
jgi:hypothetical protein